MAKIHFIPIATFKPKGVTKTIFNGQVVSQLPFYVTNVSYGKTKQVLIYDNQVIIRRHLKTGLSIIIGRIVENVDFKNTVSRSVIDRIYEVIKYLDLPLSSFERNCDIGNGYLAKMKSSNGSVGADIIKRIVNKYPFINIDWLVLGTGVMYHKKNVISPIYRLKEYLTTNDITFKKADSDLKLSRGYISKQIRAGASLTSSLLEKVLTTYTDLNPVYLLKGEGSLLLEVNN